MITPQRLRELLYYDPASGEFTWLCQRNGGAYPGSRAGYLNSRGRRQISIDGSAYTASRLAWLYVTGEWPTGQIDHIDRNRTNDRFANLRIATASQNAANRVLARPVHAGLPRGVSRHHNRFVARISVANRSVYVGSYATAEEASAAYLTVANELHGPFMPKEACQ